MSNDRYERMKQFMEHCEKSGVLRDPFSPEGSGYCRVRILGDDTRYLIAREFVSGYQAGYMAALKEMMLGKAMP